MAGFLPGDPGRESASRLLRIVGRCHVHVAVGLSFSFPSWRPATVIPSFQRPPAGLGSRRPSSVSLKPAKVGCVVLAVHIPLASPPGLSVLCLPLPPHLSDSLFHLPRLLALQGPRVYIRLTWIVQDCLPSLSQVS